MHSEREEQECLLDLLETCRAVEIQNKILSDINIITEAVAILKGTHLQH